MREIKFRAWDVFNGCYLYSDNFDNLAEFFDECQKYIDGGNDVIFELFTNLKDKNGKEIFESDVVRLGKHNKPDMMAVIKFMKGCFMMEWLAENIRTRDFNMCMYEEIFENSHISLEVIGNIYENKELLIEKGG